MKGSITTTGAAIGVLGVLTAFLLSQMTLQVDGQTVIVPSLEERVPIEINFRELETNLTETVIYEVNESKRFFVTTATLGNRVNCDVTNVGLSHRIAYGDDNDISKVSLGTDGCTVLGEGLAGGNIGVSRQNDIVFSWLDKGVEFVGNVTLILEDGIDGGSGVFSFGHIIGYEVEE